MDEGHDRIAVMGGELMTLGFKVSGVKMAIVSRPGDSVESIEENLRNLFRDGSIGVIIISESISRKIRDRKLIHMIDSSLLPVVVEVPDYGEEERNEDTLKRLIKRAIGIDIGVVKG